MKKFIPVIFMILFAVLLLVMGKSAPEHAPDADAYRQHPILAFGDSLTYGTGADRHQSYPAMLQRMSGVKVVNAGVPGETSAEGLKRLRVDAIAFQLFPERSERRRKNGHAVVLSSIP